MNGQMLSKICSDIEIEGSDKLLMGTKIFNSIKHFGMRKLVHQGLSLGWFAVGTIFLMSY
jgi:hypothetical protein